MRGCDPTTIAAKLELALEVFHKRKFEVYSQWQDATSRGFEEKYLVPMEPKFRRALEAIHHLAETLQRAERDCS